MTTEPVVWHYGLMAERWAEFINDCYEAPFFLKQIVRFGQPVLDVGCGTGRVMLPLLRAGIDIDGCDISGDMLKYCRKKAAGEGFNPNLYDQPMHAFAISRSYRTIYICGSFGLAGSFQNDLETLKRCHAHLEAGGALVLNIQPEYTSSEAWNLWLHEQRQSLPQPWPKKGEGKVAADGSVHFAQFRLINIDPLEQSYTREVRLEKWLNNQLVSAEEHVLRGNMYFKNDLLLMLTIAGFREISVYGDFTERPPSAEDEELVFIAIK
jgi:SAM-dependent methyltransferase